jgi:hypothetical protein
MTFEELVAAAVQRAIRPLQDKLDAALAAAKAPAATTSTADVQWRSLAQASKKTGLTVRRLKDYIEAGSLRADRPAPNANYRITDAEIARFMSGETWRAAPRPATPADLAVEILNKKGRK